MTVSLHACLDTHFEVAQLQFSVSHAVPDLRGVSCEVKHSLQLLVSLRLAVFCTSKFFCIRKKITLFFDYYLTFLYYFLSTSIRNLLLIIKSINVHICKWDVGMNN